MTRTPADISRLFAYGRWASELTLASAAELDAKQFVQPVGGSFGSGHGTLVHLYGADWVWLERWQGRSPRALPTGQDASTLDAIARMWREVQQKQMDFVEALAPERMAQPLSYVNFKGETFKYPLGETLVHRRQPRHVSPRPGGDAAPAARQDARLDRLPALSRRASRSRERARGPRPRARESSESDHERAGPNQVGKTLPLLRPQQGVQLRQRRRDGAAQALGALEPGRRPHPAPDASKTSAAIAPRTPTAPGGRPPPPAPARS